MRNLYFRCKDDVQPKGMSQKRTCHGSQPNHPLQSGCQWLFPLWGPGVSQLCQGQPGRGRGSSLWELWAPPAEGRELELTAQPRALPSSPPVPPEPCALCLCCPGRVAAKKWLINFMVSFNPLENIFPMCTEWIICYFLITWEDKWK